MLFAWVSEVNAKEDIVTYHLGGYILFGRDVEGESLESIAAKTQSWQDVAKIKLFIGIDEEGGMVSRFSYAGLADFKSPQELFSLGGMDLIKENTIRKIDLLKEIGVNVDFAPVADICANKKDFIYDRTFGQNAEETSEYIKEIVELYRDSEVSTTLKHFPGYGNNVDTHSGIAIDGRELEAFESVDFLPFKAGI